MKVVFLDFDGVINSLQWIKNENNEWKCKYSANIQSIQWISEFCEKYNYKVIISSTWRYDGLEKCKKYLYDNSFRRSIDIIDTTPILHTKRGDEITEWLSKHPVEKYIIFDDDSDMTIHMNRLIKSNCFVGFTYKEYLEAEKLENQII